MGRIVAAHRPKNAVLIDEVEPRNQRAGLGADGIEVADDRRRSEADASEVVRPAVGGEYGAISRTAFLG